MEHISDPEARDKNVRERGKHRNDQENEKKVKKNELKKKRREEGGGGEANTSCRDVQTEEEEGKNLK